MLELLRNLGRFYWLCFTFVNRTCLALLILSILYPFGQGHPLTKHDLRLILQFLRRISSALILILILIIHIIILILILILILIIINLTKNRSLKLVGSGSRLLRRVFDCLLLILSVFVCLSFYLEELDLAMPLLDLHWLFSYCFDW